MKIVQRDAVSYAAITRGQKTLKCSLLVCFGVEESGGPTQADRRHQCRGQRLIKQRGTFAPALLTNLSPVKMTAGEAWHSPRPYAKSPSRLLCPINSQNDLSVYRWVFWHDPLKSYGYAIMSWGGQSIFAGLFYHYDKRFRDSLWVDRVRKMPK